MRSFLVAAVLLIPIAAHAQTKPATLRVATREVKPFVFRQGNQLQGFSIELWQEIGLRLGITTEFVVKPTVQDLLESVRSKDTALGISAVSITSEREQAFDLSQPMFDAGLEILTPVTTTSGGLFDAIVSGVLTSAALPILGGVVVVILIIAHLVWLFERHNPSGVLTSRSYYPGILEAAWWAASTLATQADQMPRAALSRIIAVIWMFASVVFIAYFTASVTSTLTVQHLRGDINGPDDLPGKRVATVVGTTSEEYLLQHNIERIPFSKIEGALDALRHGDADAVVYDAPVLMYYASHDGSGKVQTVGSSFRRESYGIVFPTDSPYRKRVNEALLHIKEDGTYDRLYAKWFGGGRS
ncbi:MAG TPA: transporter substrate-binding domain-containing protein [Vicinamibacterales bacterium]|jgi:polar amino acid transport system substrate-binding protein